MTIKQFERAKILTLLIKNESSIMREKKVPLSISQMSFFVVQSKSINNAIAIMNLGNLNCWILIMENHCTSWCTEKLSEYYAIIWYSCTKKNIHKESLSRAWKQREVQILAYIAILKHASGSSTLSQFRWKR